MQTTETSRPDRRRDLTTHADPAGVEDAATVHWEGVGTDFEGQTYPRVDLR